MKKADIVFACAVVAVFLPFVLSEPVYEAYKSFTRPIRVSMPLTG